MTTAVDDRPRAPFGVRESNVIARERVGPYVVLTVLDDAGPRPRPGQFYMIRSSQRWGGGEDGRPYLPRALSFARCDQRSDGLALDFFFEPVGPGTGRLAELEVGEQVVLTGPLGNGFAVDPELRPVLVAGGIGLAPIVALDDWLRGGGIADKDVLIGMRSAEHAQSAQFYGLDHELATDDGSAGRSGFVTELLSEAIDLHGDCAIYACGPPAMLESVRALASERSVSAQLAMEAGMACGFGACYGCIVETKTGYQRLCVDGPVLGADCLDSALTAGAH